MNTGQSCTAGSRILVPESRLAEARQALKEGIARLGVTNEMRIAREEIFGPVLSVIAYQDDEDAVRIANDSDYGLHAYVFGTDAARARRVANQLLAGRVTVNEFIVDPAAPFGGFKLSGLGREFGRAGLESYLETRVILSH